MTEIKENNELDPSKVEKTGNGFDSAKLQRAQSLSLEAVDAIADQIQPGMSEEDALAMAVRTLKERGASKLWHRTWVRFGRNTVYPYGVPSEEGVVLGENDVFFIDIGPVWDGYEGDAAKTFVVGDAPLMQKCADDGRAVFDLVKRRWQQSGDSGNALYQFARDEVEKRGWKFLLEDANGHRLGDFPHAIHFRGGVSELAFRPTPYHWMLEIQIKHPTLPFGAFHEDLLA